MSSRGMSYAEQEAALERAAAPALAAIEEDELRAPKWLRPLFASSRDLLFHPDLDREQIQKAAGFADAEVWNAMREETGQPSWNYFRDARLETGANLLRETEMSIAEIGRLVGYSSTPSFRRLLRTFLGMHAPRYRARARRRLRRAGPLPAGAETNRYWERMQDGELSDEEARALDAYLGRLAPASAPAADDDEERWRRLRRTFAEGLVETLDPIEPLRHVVIQDGRRQTIPAAGAERSVLPFDEQRRLVREAVWFPDGTLFEVLSERGARAEPRRGVELAILAVDYLITSRIPEVDPRQVPLAWARLARARWRDGDLPGARRDLETSALGAAEDDPPPARWEAERSRIAAAFDWHRGRRRQALELADHSVAEHRAAESPELAMALVLRAELRAAVAALESEAAGARATRLRDALTDLREAEDLAGTPAAETPAAGTDLQALPRAEAEGWDPGLVARSATSPGKEGLGQGSQAARLGFLGARARVSLLIRLLPRVASRAELAAALPALRRAAGGLGDGLAPRLRWLEGHATGAAGVAETAWRATRERFVELGDELWVARATLDFARLCLADGRPGEAAALATELGSRLAAAGAGGRESVALVRRGPFYPATEGALDRAESALERLEWQRRARRALDLA